MKHPDNLAEHLATAHDIKPWDIADPVVVPSARDGLSSCGFGSRIRRFWVCTGPKVAARSGTVGQDDPPFSSALYAKGFWWFGGYGFGAGFVRGA
jgi:hypothetical protein